MAGKPLPAFILPLHAADDNAPDEILLEEGVDHQYRNDAHDGDRHADAHAGQLAHIHVGRQGALAAGDELDVGDDGVQYGLDAEQFFIV